MNKNINILADILAKNFTLAFHQKLLGILAAIVFFGSQFVFINGKWLSG
jgi:hypothetical protein